MNYKKILKIIVGCFFIFGGIVALCDTITWLVAQKDYNKEYIYSDLGVLSYEKNNEKIYIEEIYNTDGEIIELNVPDKKTIIMYCYKDNPTEGIYLGIDNTPDWRLQYPIINIYLSMLFLVVGIFILSKKNTSNPIKNFYLFYVLLFLIGIGMLCYQIYNIINYCSIKDDNNMVNATIYSDLYDTGVSNDKYKTVSYYYVNNEKYIYVNDVNKNGNINDVIGTTQELYYNPDNPNQVCSKITFFNIFLLIIGIFITAITFPIVFFNRKMANRFNNAIRKK